MLTHYKTEICSHSLNSINRIFGTVQIFLSAFQRNNLLSKRDKKTVALDRLRSIPDRQTQSQRIIIHLYTNQTLITTKLHLVPTIPFDLFVVSAHAIRASPFMA